MIRLSTKVQLLVFALVTVVGVAYVGAAYIGINPLNRPYTVYVDLPSAGGIFPNADVAERGVVVGKVGALRISGDRTGVVAALKINHGTRIPSTGLTARVANLSAVGEQYVELEPTTSSAPYLEAGQTLATEGRVPVDDATILLNLQNLLGSVNVKDLSVVIKELAASFDNLGPTLQSLIDNGNALTRSAIDALPATLRLIDDGKTVLDTQNDVASELKSFAASLSSLTGEVSSKDTALRGVLDNGALASVQLEKLLKANQPVLPTLLNNLNTVTGILDVRLPQTRTVLELYPSLVGDAFYALPKPAKGGQTTARFGLVTDIASSFCATGYSSTHQRPNRPSSWGGAANLDAYCHGNNAALDAASQGVRGARNVVRPKGDTSNITNSDPYDGPHYGQKFPGSGKVGACGTVKCPSGDIAKAARSLTGYVPPRPGNSRSHPAASASASASASGSASATATPKSTTSSDSVIPVPYNPSTGMIEGLNGKLYQLGLNGPVAPAFGSASYTWLLLAPTMR
jgi:phospholipid/cholesterol/gamma-HCH transport system substrate-binding protein